MAEYIEREATKELLEHYGATDDALALIDSVSSADAVPVRHGRWIEEYGETFIPIEYDTNGEPILHNYVGYHCSLCGRYEPVQEPYCNCGALMDGKEGA